MPRNFPPPPGFISVDGNRLATLADVRRIAGAPDAGGSGGVSEETDPVATAAGYQTSAQVATAVSTHAAAADPHTGYVQESLYDANTVLFATTDNTPAALTVATSTVVGRNTSGAIDALTMSALRTLLALASTNISDFTEAVQDVVGAYATSGSGVAATYDDSGNTLTVSRGAVTVNAQTGTSYTLVLADAPKFVTMSNASASTLTVPLNSSVAYPVGTIIEGAQLGAGQVTITATGGVTINATPGLKIAAQYGTFGLIKTATDTWLAYGRLSA